MYLRSCRIVANSSEFFIFRMSRQIESDEPKMVRHNMDSDRNQGDVSDLAVRIDTMSMQIDNDDPKMVWRTAMNYQNRGIVGDSPMSLVCCVVLSELKERWENVWIPNLVCYFLFVCYFRSFLISFTF